MAGREHDGLTDLAPDPAGTGTEGGSWVIWALEEYAPGTAFPGVIGRTAEEPGPAWPAGRRCLRRVPGAGDEVDARLWLLGSGDFGLGEGAVLFRNELVVADAGAGAARAAKPG
jgi:hypothetical protein